MKITDILRAEHSVFHNLFDHIEATAPRLKSLAEVKAVAVLIDKVMAPHSHTEDELFIDPLEHCFDQIGQKETFHHEHEEIERTLVKVTKARALNDAKRLLLDVITASRKHFEKEERIVFPMAERILKAKTLTELGARWMHRRNSKPNDQPASAAFTPATSALTRVVNGKSDGASSVQLRRVLF